MPKHTLDELIDRVDEGRYVEWEEAEGWFSVHRAARWYFAGREKGGRAFPLAARAELRAHLATVVDGEREPVVSKPHPEHLVDPFVTRGYELVLETSDGYRRDEWTFSLDRSGAITCGVGGNVYDGAGAAFGKKSKKSQADALADVERLLGEGISPNVRAIR